MLRLLIFQGLLTYVTSTGWSVSMPKEIPALKDDCVVIPCQFTLPAKDLHKQRTIIWYQHETQKTIFPKDSSMPKSRATLLGNLDDGNCTLWIRDIKKEDSKKYRFIIQVQGGINYTSPVLIDLSVSDTPEAPELQVSSNKITEGREVTVTCRTNSTCTMRPLALVWNRVLGEVVEEVVDLGNGIWQFVSSQTFTASSSHHGLVLNCETNYTKIQAKPRSQSYPMNVLYRPQNISLTVNTNKDIREGQNISLKCSSKSNPPPNYTWHWLTHEGEMIPLPGEKSTILITNITRSVRSFYCTVRNTVGSQTSPVLTLNITHKPQITSESHCRPRLSITDCRCRVTAYPRASIVWLLRNDSLNETRGGYEVSSASHDHVTESRITGPSSAMAGVSCRSENTEGAAELLLPFYMDILKVLLTVGVPGIFLVLLVGVAVTLKFWRKRWTQTGIENKTENEYNPHVFSAKESCPMESPVYGNNEYVMHPSEQDIYDMPESDDQDSFSDCPDETIYANT